MPELHENDLRNVFRTAGHAVPARDLTDRILARVAVTPIAKPVVVEPVIGKQGWMTISGAVAAVLVILLLSTSGPSDEPWSWTASVWERLGRIHLPSGNWPIWLALGSACALLFSYLDGVLAAARTHR